MSVSILLLTHSQIGHSILNASERILGKLPTNTMAVDVDFDCTPEVIIGCVEQFISKQPEDSDVLILTDMYGATPSNIAQHFLKNKKIKIITGLNLPMLIRSLNYSHLSIEETYKKALSGGKEGIILCQPE